MSYENWKDKIGTFEVMDVRGKKMDFFPALKAKAAALKNGEGLHIIQVSHKRRHKKRSLFVLPAIDTRILNRYNLINKYKEL